MSTEKKTINYNGMKLECIESGYWPDGIIQSHVLENWRQWIMCDGDCTNAIILNFIEIDNA